MKKITETQLKDKVSSLREYLKVYEAEMQAQGDDSGNTTFTRPDGSTMVVGPDGKQIMPGSNPNLPQNKGFFNTIGNYLQNKGDFQKPGGFQPAPAAPANQGASVTPAVPAAPTGTQVQTDDNGNHMITTPDGKTMVVGPDGKPLENGGREAPAPGPAAVKIARFKELLAKAKEKRTDTEVKASKDLGNFAGESTTYFLDKLRLIESRQLNELLSAEEQKEMDSLYAELGSTEVPEPGVAELINQYNTLKQPAQAAQVTPVAPAAPTGPVTWKQIYDANKAVIGANPNLIKPGQQLKMPDGSTYTVKPGDNLNKIAKNASGGQGASVSPVTPPKAPTAPTAPELTQAQQNLTNAGMYKSGDELRTPDEIKQSASLADTPGNIDAGLDPSDPRHSGHAAWQALAGRNAATAAATQSASDGVNQGARSSSTRGVGSSPMRPAITPRPRTNESVGYNELQRIVSLVNHR